MTNQDVEGAGNAGVTLTDASNAHFATTPTDNAPTARAGRIDPCNACSSNLCYHPPKRAP